MWVYLSMRIHTTIPMYVRWDLTAINSSSPVMLSPDQTQSAHSSRRTSFGSRHRVCHPVQQHSGPHPLSIVGGMIWGPFLAGLYDGSSGDCGCTGVLVDSLAEEPASKRPGEFASGGGSWSADRHVCLYGCPLLVCGASVAGYYCPVSVFCRPVSSSQFPLLAAVGPVSPDCAEPDEKHHPVHCKICLAHGRIAVLQLIYAMIYVLFAPWTLLLVPVLDFGTLPFLSQFSFMNLSTKNWRLKKNSKLLLSKQSHSQTQCLTFTNSSVKKQPPVDWFPTGGCCVKIENGGCPHPS